jgi:tripartite-type tricarboxylate transporter receptor subunit TctC
MNMTVTCRACAMARAVISAVLAAVFCVASPVAFTQAYPAKPIHLIVPHAPGTNADLLGRLIGPKVGASLGQPIVVDNRGGASGIPATEFVARAAPDGYTIWLGANDSLINVVILQKNLPYDPFKDLAPIGPGLAGITVLMIGTSNPSFDSLQGLVEYARRNPGKVSYGTNGVAGFWHVMGELLQSAAGIRLLHVPYKTTVVASQDVIAGRLDLTFGSAPAVKPFIATGKAKAIAVGNKQRFSGMPDVPTVSEVVPAFESAASWFSFWGPAGLPQPVVGRLNAEFNKVMGVADVRNWLDDNGLVLAVSTPAELAALHRSGFALVKKAITAAGIKPE